MRLAPQYLRPPEPPFNADTEHINGISEMGFSAVALYYQTDEAAEGKNAFIEKRKPDFRGVLQRSKKADN